MIGSRVGSYRITRLLGEGGMGAVYEAVNEAIERRVAIKFLKEEFARKADIVGRFFNEARAVNRVSHPSIVQIHEQGQLPDGTAYIIMELLDGVTLSDRLAQTGGRLPEKSALEVTWQVAAALSAAHAKGIVHRVLSL
jgi:serine/threonine protein kinase